MILKLSQDAAPSSSYIHGVIAEEHSARTLPSTKKIQRFLCNKKRQNASNAPTHDENKHEYFAEKLPVSQPTSTCSGYECLSDYPATPGVNSQSKLGSEIITSMQPPTVPSSVHSSTHSVVSCGPASHNLSSVPVSDYVSSQEPSSTAYTSDVQDTSPHRAKVSSTEDYNPPYSESDEICNQQADEPSVYNHNNQSGMDYNESADTEYLNPPSVAYSNPPSVAYSNPPSICFTEPPSVGYSDPSSIDSQEPLSVGTYEYNPLSVAYSAPPSVAWSEPPSVGPYDLAAADENNYTIDETHTSQYDTANTGDDTENNLTIDDTQAPLQNDISSSQATLISNNHQTITDYSNAAMVYTSNDNTLVTANAVSSSSYDSECFNTMTQSDYVQSVQQMQSQQLNMLTLMNAQNSNMINSPSTSQLGFLPYSAYPLMAPGLLHFPLMTSTMTSASFPGSQLQLLPQTLSGVPVGDLTLGSQPGQQLPPIDNSSTSPQQNGS